MHKMNELGWLQKQAGLVRRLYVEKHITYDEYREWNKELQQPKTFLGWVSWKVFGI